MTEPLKFKNDKQQELTEIIENCIKNNEPNDWLDRIKYEACKFDEQIKNIWNIHLEVEINRELYKCNFSDYTAAVITSAIWEKLPELIIG